MRWAAAGPREVAVGIRKRTMLVLSGAITLVRDRAETFRAGDHCETAAGCQHTAQVGHRHRRLAYSGSPTNLSGPTIASRSSGRL